MTHGLWNLRVKVDGETITDAEPVIGYLHRGWEKMVEDRQYPQIIPMADRLCYGSSFTWSHVYCLAAEDLMGVEVPERAKYIRVMSDELQSACASTHCGRRWSSYAYGSRALCCAASFWAGTS
jgi:NADH-quinone oxidoreductase subunit D